MNSKTELQLKLRDFRKSLNMNQTDFASKVGLSQAAIANMESGTREVSKPLIVKIFQTFGTNLISYETETKQEQVPQRESLIVDYYENPKLNLQKHPTFNNYLMDRDLARSYNPDYKDSDFKILCALDDVMDGGSLWIRPNDVVLLDVTYDNADKIGMYVYECMDGTYMRAAEINKLMNGDYEFRYSNPKYETQIMKAEELKEVKFRVVGRIIKNLMFFA